MNLIWSTNAWEDYLYWQKQNKKMLSRINTLIKAIQRDPFDSIGNPEPLKHHWQGCWSRRVTREHRLVYRIQADALWIIQCRFHY